MPLAAAALGCFEMDAGGRGWRNLGEKPVVETPWFRLRQAEVELPDGQRIDHYLLRLPPYLPAAAAREALKESGWEPSQLSLLLRLEPSGGLTDSVAHVYWTRHAEYRGDPVAGFEAERIEWIPLREIPGLIADGQIRAAVTAASLLYLLQKP
jgi:hypothetical protein